METANEVAVGLAAWLNNSETKNHGIEPGPIANMMTYTRTKTMHKTLAVLDVACNNKFNIKSIITVFHKNNLPQTTDPRREGRCQPPYHRNQPKAMFFFQLSQQVQGTRQS